jgi:thymidine kinase
MAQSNNIPGSQRLEIVFGPMFSGKSTELLRRIRRRIRRHGPETNSCVIVKYKLDLRYSDDFSTHDMSTHPAISCDKNLFAIAELLSSYSVIGIDEGQFFVDIVPFVTEMLKQGKTIIISALDGDYQQNEFGNVSKLIPLCDSVKKLNAVCDICSADAPFTWRTAKDDDLEVIGGADKYVAVCRTCLSDLQSIKSYHQDRQIEKK